MLNPKCPFENTPKREKIWLMEKFHRQFIHISSASSSIDKATDSEPLPIAFYRNKDLVEGASKQGAVFGVCGFEMRQVGLIWLVTRGVFRPQGATEPPLGILIRGL
jgi:hypothetical protein